MMETLRIVFEPFLGEGERRFVIDGVDNHNIAATSLPGQARGS